MFTEILKVIPKLDPAGLSAMDSSLTQRFVGLSKKFGKGLKNALLGGGAFGVALSLIDKFLNPLKEVEDSMAKILSHADDVVTNAEQFGTTAGKLFKLQQLGIANGLDPEQLNVLIQKFQASVAEAKADPTKNTSVRNFTDNPDTADAFFEFIQALQKMDKNQQVLVQQEVFGEKQILKMADFLRANFAEQSAKIFGNKGSEDFTPGLKKLGATHDLSDLLTAKRNVDNLPGQAANITDEIVKKQDEIQRIKDERELNRFKSYDDIAAISEASENVKNIVEKGMLDVASIGKQIAELVGIVKQIGGMRFLRSFFPKGD